MRLLIVAFLLLLYLTTSSTLNAYSKAEFTYTYRLFESDTISSTYDYMTDLTTRLDIKDFLVLLLIS